jgi:hypothetical protein
MGFKLNKSSESLFHKVSESKLDGGKVTQQPQVNMEAPSSPAKVIDPIGIGATYSLGRAAIKKGLQIYSDYKSGKSAREKNESVKPKVETETKTNVKPKADLYAKASKKDSKLSDYVAKRKTLKKGSAEWNANQNKINKAYGVKKRYAETAKPVSTIKPASIQASGAKPTANVEVKKVEIKKPVQAVESKPAKQTKSQKLRSKGEAVLSNDNFSTAKKQRKSKRIRKRYDKAVAKEQKQNNKKTKKSSAPDYSGGASGFM